VTQKHPEVTLSEAYQEYQLRNAACASGSYCGELPSSRHDSQDILIPRMYLLQSHENVVLLIKSTSGLSEFYCHLGHDVLSDKRLPWLRCLHLLSYPRDHATS
jgi:hypothetical protein